MSIVEPTPRERELLRLVLDRLAAQDAEEPVTHQWIQQQLGVEKSRVSDLKRQLISKGYLSKDRHSFLLTKKAHEYLTGSNNLISTRIGIVTQIALRGKVKGGRTKQDEIEVDLTTSSETISTIPIPYVPSDTEVFALHVVGPSMEHEGIHEGDYVLLQPFMQSQGPKQGELIVTKYLAPKDEPLVDDLNFTIIDVSPDLLEGPTVKFFTESADEEYPYRLSWRKDVDRSPYTIRTKYIAPIGRVVGVYRVIGNPLH